jgi:hypothetical protein
VVFIQLASLLVAAGLATAAGASRPPSFSLPEQASEVAPGVFFLGEFVQDGVVLEGYAYARYAEPAEVGRRGNAKPPWAKGGSGGGEETDASTCYSFIAKGAKWNTVEGYVYDLENKSIGSVTKSGIDGAFGAWGTAARNDIVGSGVPGNSLTADTSSTDGQNEIYFADISDPGVLGYTIVWYTRSRGRFVGQIVESDMVIDDDGDWFWYTGTDGGPIGSAIDFWGVFTHEAGHWVGMGHTKTTDLCNEQTMYPYIGAGDLSKRILETGDTTGVFALYN